jgi:hypothetical protein
MDHFSAVIQTGAVKLTQNCAEGENRCSLP